MSTSRRALYPSRPTAAVPGAYGKKSEVRMLKKWLVGLVACASLLGAKTVAAEKIDFDRGVDVKSIIQSLQTQVAQQVQTEKAGVASWTVMVYINAKNNLEQFGLLNTNQMEMVGSTDKVKIAVELGRLSTYDSSDGGWKGERRYIIQKDKDTNHISSEVKQQIDKADMGDWHHLVDFVSWAKKTAPAKHYMLIVWNHGSGWDKFQKANDVVINGISYDDETGNHMSTQDLGNALAAIGKIDIYASDACLMQMAEVGYQIKDYASYIVGSEETEPGDGYTYNTILDPLVAKPAMSALELSKVTVQSYQTHYASDNNGATQSAIDAATLPKLMTLLDGWTKAVMAANETSVVKNARSQAQHFYTRNNKDLLHFVQLVDSATRDQSVKSQGAQLEDFLANTVIVANGTDGNSMANAKGLAIYLPDSSYNSDYDELAWAKNGAWSQFAQWAQGLKSRLAIR